MELRKKQQQEQNKNIPSNLKGIAYLWNDIKTLENKKRVRKSRIYQIEGKGSGYGLSHVPVLAANNYTFGGETDLQGCFGGETDLQGCRWILFITLSNDSSNSTMVDDNNTHTSFGKQSILLYFSTSVRSRRTSRCKGVLETIEVPI